MLKIKNIDLNRSSVTVMILFLTAFALTKGGQFFIPIALANILPREVYGAVELAMSMALVLLSIVSFGTTAFISRRIIENEAWINLSLIRLYLVIISVLLFSCSVLFYFLDNAINSSMVFLFCAVLLLQGTISTELKSKQKRKTSLFVDVLLWVLILLWAFVNYSQKLVEPSYSLWLITLYFFVLLIKISTAINLYDLKGFQRWKKYIKEGLNIVLMGFIGVLVATSGRLVVGFGIGEEAAGNYSSLYRIAIFPIIIHQVIMLYFYKKSFEKDSKQFKLIGSSVFWIITSISITFFIISHYVHPFFGDAFNTNFINYPIAFLALTLSVPFWSASSINELAYYKDANSIFPLIISISYISICIFITIFIVSLKSLEVAAIYSSILVIGYFLVNSLSLIKIGLPVAKSPLAAGSMVIIFLLFMISSYLTN
jgi:O-antigen/teichoic acid export membrane protein